MKFLLRMNKNNIFLSIIVIFAIFLRFFQLDTNPPSLTWDEASWGINAYTLSISGRDEFGKFLPITYLESFGDFKPPVYAYLTVIPVWIFGVNEFSIRFMSALLGSLTVLLTYFLVKELFFSNKKNEVIALIASFLFAISPWHTLLSRAAFEANVATFFIVLGVLLFLKGTQKKLHLFIFTLSLFSFVVAMHTFNTSRVFLPLFVVVLFFLKKSVLFLNWKKTILGLLIPFLASIPLLIFMLTPQAQLRFQEVNIFSDISVIERTNKLMENSENTFISRIIYNRRFAYAVEFISHYLDNLNPAFLFIKGDGNPKFSIQDVGQMYLWELPFLVVGAFLIFRKRDGYSIILPIWILLGIIPAATARETPHALRIETTLPVFQVITAYGLFFSYEYILKIKYKILNLHIKYLMFTLCIVFFIFNLLYFLHNYFIHYPVKYASEWQYGYRQAIEFTEEQKENYEKIYFTQDLGRPYVYVMLYGNYPVDVIQKNAHVRREALGFVHVDSLGKYQFSKILPERKDDALFVSISGKVPEGANILKTIYLPNGDPALVIYE